MLPDDPDHRAILARRAALIASALAAMGCSPGATPGAETAPGVVPIPTPPDDGDSPPPPEAPPPEPPAPTQVGQAPSLVVPTGVGETAKDNYQRLHARMESLYALLDAAEADIPRDCAVTDPACKAKWTKVAEHLHEMRRLLTFAYHCPGSSEEAVAFGVREKEHRDHYALRQKILEERIAEVLGTDAAKTQWEAIQAEVNAAKPFPCLSYGCTDW